MRLHAAEIEKAFVQVAVDLHEVIVLDGVEAIDDHAASRVRSPDLYGALPEIVVSDQADRMATLGAVSREACKLVAITEIRQKLTRLFPGADFLPPAVLDGKAVAGIRIGPKIILAEGRTALGFV